LALICSETLRLISVQSSWADGTRQVVKVDRRFTEWLRLHHLSLKYLRALTTWRRCQPKRILSN